MPSNRHHVRLIKDLAREAGFDRVGITAAKPPPHAHAFRRWLEPGYAAQMSYLHRHVDVRVDPRMLLPGARSVICLAVNYHHRSTEAERGETSGRPTGRIARYARGLDYHRVLRRRLDDLIARLRVGVDESFEARPFVDTAPVLERDLAAAAGVGWIGKNTMLITPGLGSYTYLAGLATTLDLQPDEPTPDRCGRCRRCIDACPTGAIIEPYVVDARRCLSYLTIEHRDAIPEPFRTAIGDRVFGCDACQAACPHNRRAPSTNDPVWTPADESAAPNLIDLVNCSRDAYLALTRGRATRRAKQWMLRRNAALALGNVGSVEHADALRVAARDDDPLVAEHAAWALERL